MLDKPDWQVYLTAFYFCLTTLTTIGYGDITPFTNSSLSLTSRNSLRCALDDLRSGLLLSGHRIHQHFLYFKGHPGVPAEEEATDDRGLLPELAPRPITLPKLIGLDSVFFEQDCLPVAEQERRHLQ